MLCITVQGAVEKFIDEYLQCHKEMKTIGCMLNTIDRSIANYRESNDRDQEYSTEALKELAENQSLKAQLMSQLEDVKKENDRLKRGLDKMKTCQSSHDEQVGMLLKEIQELKSKLEAKKSPGQTCSTHVNSQVKVFNSIPKSLRSFYNQMENGTEELPKFSELGDFKTNKSTKAAYCKHKAIFSFIKAYAGGIDECLRNFDHLSPHKKDETSN